MGGWRHAPQLREHPLDPGSTLDRKSPNLRQRRQGVTRSAHMTILRDSNTCRWNHGVFRDTNIVLSAPSVLFRPFWSFLLKRPVFAHSKRAYLSNMGTALEKDVGGICSGKSHV